MMKVRTCLAGEGRMCLDAVITAVGNDLSVAISGGDVPHIGAVAIGVPRPSLRNNGSTSSSASVYCVTGHKEDMLARQGALELSSFFQCVVTVSVGIHFENPDPTLFIQLEIVFERLLKEIELILKQERGDNIE